MPAELPDKLSAAWRGSDNPDKRNRLQLFRDDPPFIVTIEVRLDVHATVKCERSGRGAEVLNVPPKIGHTVKNPLWNGLGRRAPLLSWQRCLR